MFIICKLILTRSSGLRSYNVFRFKKIFTIHTPLPCCLVQTIGVLLMLTWVKQLLPSVRVIIVRGNLTCKQGLTLSPTLRIWLFWPTIANLNPLLEPIYSGVYYFCLCCSYLASYQKLLNSAHWLLGLLLTQWTWLLLFLKFKFCYFWMSFVICKGEARLQPL